MRRNDWQERFAAFAKTRASMAFAWGSNDCCTFAAAAVDAISGVNPMASAPSYDTEAGAAKLILRAGSLEALANQYLGASVVPAFAAVGDVVLMENAGRDLLAVCNGVNAIGPGPDGISVLEMSAARAAWKI